jgi:hypothetical protein
MKKINISKEELYDLYITKGYTASYIAEHVMYCDITTVYARTREYGIYREEERYKKRTYLHHKSYIIYI